MKMTLEKLRKKNPELFRDFRRYTNPNDKQYDPVFDRLIRKLAPHWFGPDGQPLAGKVEG